MDQNITEGAAVEVYGDYCEDPEGCSVSLIGYDGYYIRSIHKGDLNHDGEITQTDAAIALAIAASGGWNADADVNGDLRITALDALMILQAGTGAITL